jgi:DNA-directed RNA polymerase specialized sigma24 family protein
MNDVDLACITENTDPLQALREATALRRRLEGHEEVLVHRARVSGTTWTQIAEALGVSKQAVHKKYGGRRLFGRTEA